MKVIDDLFEIRSFLGRSWMLYLLKTQFTDIHIPSQNNLVTVYLFLCLLYSALHFLHLLVTNLLCLWSYVVQLTNPPKISPYFTILWVIIHHQLSLTPRVLPLFYALKSSIEPPNNEIIGMGERLLPDHVGFADGILRMWVFDFEIRDKCWWLFLHCLFFCAYHFKNEWIISSPSNYYCTEFIPRNYYYERFDLKVDLTMQSSNQRPVTHWYFIFNNLW